MKGYVVCFCERLRDGTEEGAKVFPTREKAIEFINKIANGFAGDNCDFRLFELGKEIPIRGEKVEEVEKKVKTSNKFSVRDE